MDTIVGISILQPIWIPRIYRLWFRARKGSGEESQSWIFIKDKAAVDLPDRVLDYPEWRNQIWKFTRAGDTLHCEPSVNWISWGFHNPGTWSTKYLEMITPETPDYANGPDPQRYERGSAVHMDVNASAKVGREADLIKELKDCGILE